MNPAQSSQRTTASTPAPAPFSHPSFQGLIGIAREDITPPVGIYSRNWGAAKHDVATSIHRPLTLTVMTIKASASEAPLVFIDADLGWWKTPQTYESFSSRLLDALSLKSSQLIFALSHTHAGPPLMDADESLPGSDLLNSWMEDLFEKTVKTVQDSLSSQVESTLDWHSGRCNLATYRDLPDPTVENDRVLCGFNPSGTPDETLIVGRITDQSGQLRGTITNYACHPTTLAWENEAISPDYLGAMRETMQQVTGAPALFMLGACGDLAPRNQYVGDVEVADHHGRQLAYASLAVLEDMEPTGQQLAYTGAVESGAPLAVWKNQPAEISSILSADQLTVELPIKDWPTAEELEKERLACPDRALEERLRRKRDIRRGIGDGSTFQLPISTWRIGDAVLVGCCCEPYSVLQQELRQRFPEVTILCMNLINGSVGYLPPAELYDTDVYPVWQTPFDRGSLELTLEMMTQAIRDALND